MIAAFIRIFLLIISLCIVSSCSVVPTSPSLPPSNSKPTYSSGVVEVKKIGIGRVVQEEIFATENEKCRTQFLTGIVLDRCLNNIIIKGAIITKDISKCVSIPDKKMRNLCHENLLFQDMVLQQDPSRCLDLSIKELVGNCIATIERNTQSTGLCSDISDEETRGICTDMSIQNTAIATRDSSLCKDISDQKKVSICKQIIEDRKKLIETGSTQGTGESR